MDLTSEQDLLKLGVVAREVVKPVAKPPDIQVLDTASFVAHLVEGIPFTCSYDLFNGAVIIQFQTLSGCEYAAIQGLHRKDPRYEMRTLLAVASLKALQLDGVSKPVIQDHVWMTSRYANTFLQEITETQLKLILETYSKFESLFSRLLQQADSPSFSRDPVVGAVLTAISRGVLNPKSADGSTRWCLSVKTALNFVGKTDVSIDASKLSETDRLEMADKWRKHNEARKI